MLLSRVARFGGIDCLPCLAAYILHLGVIGLSVNAAYAVNVAPLPTNPASVAAVNGVASQPVPIVVPTQDPSQPTLAQLRQPSDSQLSTANQTLLATNAQLQRQVASLTTQNNVLVNERSGQLFMYGAMTALFSGLLGLGLGWLVFGRSKSRW